MNSAVAHFTRGRAFALGLIALGACMAMAQEPQADEAPAVRPIYIQEFRVVGARLLNEAEIGEAVYPFLGPGRTPKDVDDARAALEKAYHDKGFQTVGVQIPRQEVKYGVVFLQAVERKVGRLRVRGSRYFSLDQVKKHAPSVAEGKVPDFNEITRDIVALNQWQDRRVTPVLKPGVEPDTVDIDLNVKDSLPLHGSIELNNRYNANTTPLRLNGSVSYGNLWQLGHAAGFSFQLAPERLEDAKVFSGYYIVRFPGVTGFSVMFLGTKQDSNVSTLGGVSSAGRGNILGARAMFTLPSKKNFFHSASVGFDYKKFDEDVTIGGTQLITPITYYPLTASYSATWVGERTTTELNGSVNFATRHAGSTGREFDAKRFRANGNYVYFRGDLSHTRTLPPDFQLFGKKLLPGFQLFGKVQGQIADQPLINSEQFGGGGLGTARGYLESDVLGDNAIFGTAEVRTPSLLPEVKKGGDEKNPDDRTGNEWRFYGFVDAGVLTLHNPLPEQTWRFPLASVGFGSRVRFRNHFGGSIDVGIPLTGQNLTNVHETRVTFRLTADF
jgi:hemolysin activation/secretion protein